MAKAKRQPRGLGRSAAEAEATAAAATESSSARFNPMARDETSSSSSKVASTNNNVKKEGDTDVEMLDQVPTDNATAEEKEGGETASIAIKDDGGSGDEMSELRQTYEAAQKQFAETGTQEYLRGTIHECNRMVRNCGQEVYPSSEFNFIYASALHEFSIIGATPEEVSGFVDLALDYISHSAELLDKSTTDNEWAWKLYLLSGRVHLQKAEILQEQQETAKSKKQFDKLTKEIKMELIQAKNFFETGFKTIPVGVEKFIIAEDAKTIEKVAQKPHELISAATAVALHADRFEDYESRKSWNEWAKELYEKVKEDQPDSIVAHMGIATCLHSIVGWWADQEEDEDEEEEDDEEEDGDGDKEMEEDEYSLPVYQTERGQLSQQALESIKTAIGLARQTNALTSDLLTLGAECHLNMVNIAVGDKAAASQSKEAVGLINEALASFPDPALEERYAEVLAEFKSIEELAAEK